MGESNIIDKSMRSVLGLAAGPSVGSRSENADAPETLSRAVASLPPEQMFELMRQMKICIQNNPEEGRQMLLQNPQLAYALLQAQVVMRIVDPHTAITMLHKATPMVTALHQASVELSRTSTVASQPIPVQSTEWIPPKRVNMQQQQQPVLSSQGGDIDLRTLSLRSSTKITQDVRVIHSLVQHDSVSHPPTQRIPTPLTTSTRDPRQYRGAAAPVPPQPQSVPFVSPAASYTAPLSGTSGPTNSSLPTDQEKAALIMQVLQLSDEQIAMLPPDQKQSILVLKEQIAKSTRR